MFAEKLPAKKLFKNRKGIVGVEAAIVLIAFIIIAAALSYVVINMGFYTTQKTKETMEAGLEESTTALQLDGVVTAKTNDTSPHILYILVPVKLSSGKGAVDLGENSVVVSVYLPRATLMNIYKGAVSATSSNWNTLITALNLANNNAKFAIYNGDGDTVLEANEKAFLVIRLNSTDTKYMLGEYETIKIEVRAAKGAALTVVRTAPGGLKEGSFIDLG
ncbi:MAG: archaellin/type IV pilin N-terminal domain-containing protein [Candidatus Bathyarchaeia archaeon]